MCDGKVLAGVTRGRNAVFLCVYPAGFCGPQSGPVLLSVGGGIAAWMLGRETGILQATVIIRCAMLLVVLLFRTLDDQLEYVAWKKDVIPYNWIVRIRKDEAE